MDSRDNLVIYTVFQNVPSSWGDRVTQRVITQEIIDKNCLKMCFPFPHYVCSSKIYFFRTKNYNKPKILRNTVSNWTKSHVGTKMNIFFNLFLLHLFLIGYLSRAAIYFK